MNKPMSILAVTAFVFALAPKLYAEEAKPVGSTLPAATPVAAPAETSAAPASNGDVEILKAVLTNTTQDRDSGPEVTTAKVGETLIGWTQAKAANGEGSITHRWLHEADNMGDVPLAVKSASWRTWSRKTVGMSGNWKWQILDASGAVLKEVAFTVTE